MLDRTEISLMRYAWCAHHMASCSGPACMLCERYVVVACIPGSKISWVVI